MPAGSVRRCAVLQHGAGVGIEYCVSPGGAVRCVRARAPHSVPAADVVATAAGALPAPLRLSGPDQVALAAALTRARRRHAATSSATAADTAASAAARVQGAADPQRHAWLILAPATRRGALVLLWRRLLPADLFGWFVGYLPHPWLWRWHHNEVLLSRCAREARRELARGAAPLAVAGTLRSGSHRFDFELRHGCPLRVGVAQPGEGLWGQNAASWLYSRRGTLDAPHQRSCESVDRPLREGDVVTCCVDLSAGSARFAVGGVWRGQLCGLKPPVAPVVDFGYCAAGSTLVALAHRSSSW
eukprot:TRINITY_DN25697_c0_g1_i3.p2 TRINITY_DN25697_c0_g1~~TRINITY_DN25697_c0_g1_i3.p2  ORF type:complete len:301 (+),score=49.12 TRINITY_DN25697_c0_g1_i3:79-981(+)